MGRPKASPSNLSIALSFANTVTSTANKDLMTAVPVVADVLYSALARYMPFIARDQNDRHPVNRTAVTSIEFRKHLIRPGGYIGQRRRRRVSMTRDRWTTSSLIWSNRRWLNVADPADYALLVAGHDEMQRKFPTIEHDLDLARLAHVVATAATESASVALAEEEEMLQGGRSSSGGSHDCPGVHRSAADNSDKSSSAESEEGSSSDGRSVRRRVEDSSIVSAHTDRDETTAEHDDGIAGGRGVLLSARRQAGIIPRSVLARAHFARVQWPSGGGMDPAAAAVHSGMPAWASFLFNTHFQLGVPARYLASIFRHVPAELQEVLQGNCSPTQTFAPAPTIIIFRFPALCFLLRLARWPGCSAQTDSLCPCSRLGGRQDPHSPTAPLGSAAAVSRADIDGGVGRGWRGSGPAGASPRTVHARLDAELDANPMRSSDSSAEGAPTPNGDARLGLVRGRWAVGGEGTRRSSRPWTSSSTPR